MPHYGPWLDGGTFSVTVGSGNTGGVVRAISGGIAPTLFADACEEPDAGFGGGLLQHYLTNLVGAGVLYAVGTGLDYPLYDASQMAINIRQTPIRDYVDANGLAAYIGTIPPRATLVYDDGTTEGTTVPQYTVADADAEIVVPLNPDYGDATLHPLAGTIDARHALYTETWVPGATLAGRTLLASAAASGAPDESADLHVAIAEADWVYVAPIIGDPYWQRSIVLASRAQITHDSPSGSPAGLVTEGWAFYFGQPTAVTIAATVRRSRYRFVYDVLPPLRQYPRDDFLGGAPRQGRPAGSTSIQASTRQGWKGTYR